MTLPKNEIIKTCEFVVRIDATCILKPTANWSPYIFTLVQKVKHRVYKIHVFFLNAGTLQVISFKNDVCLFDLILYVPSTIFQL